MTLKWKKRAVTGRHHASLSHRDRADLSPLHFESTDGTIFPPEFYELTSHTITYIATLISTSKPMSTVIPILLKLELNDLSSQRLRLLLAIVLSGFLISIVMLALLIISALIVTIFVAPFKSNLDPNKLCLERNQSEFPFSIQLLSRVMSILDNTKKIWRRSIQRSADPNVYSSKEFVDKSSDSESHGPIVTLAVIGCGQRGDVSNSIARKNVLTYCTQQNYSVYALRAPEKCKIVAIAEPRPMTQKKFATAHKVDRTLVFNTWQELHAASTETIQTIGKRLADAVIVAVQDHMHMDVVLAFAAQGYHILCEKPMATSLEDCIKIEEAVKEFKIIFGMGHGESLCSCSAEAVLIHILTQCFDIRRTIRPSQKWYALEPWASS